MKRIFHTCSLRERLKQQISQVIAKLKDRWRSILFFAQTVFCIIFLIAFIIVYTNRRPLLSSLPCQLFLLDLATCIVIPRSRSSLDTYHEAAISSDAYPCAEFGK
ncbi:hypothetical protein Ciccas_011106 [Cichlidogyrus casuarinus]|uniref:Uncharacterized protein n=1 Tax=Cichlidogyrus casuarinus TaxID=1844966 RepID=A0ABD2PTC9_9PLAT